MVKNLALVICILVGFQLAAQKKCSNESYILQQLKEDPSFQNNLESIEAFTRNQGAASSETQRLNRVPSIIKVPVVVHVLYRTPEQNLSTSLITNMIAALNRDFNKKNSDTTNTPQVFKSLSADMGFEFNLATSDPRGIGTSGIVRKYTPIRYWLSDDKMKFSESFGDDAWDTKNYLNIWLCNMQDVLGYSTLPGGDITKDGIVLSFDDFKAPQGVPGISDNRTAVHEAGHWLNLYHVWGEGYCGDDKVDDTPKQSTYTPGCPSGTRLSCGNSSTGDMYMNFMDFTNNDCMNMFTLGQRKRARILFEPGGPRSSILSSRGLNKAVVQGAQLPDFYPKWLYAHVYPNPATSMITMYCEYDERWIGRKLHVVDMAGKVVINKIIKSKIEQIDISRLSPGVYYICAEKEEEKLHAKFIKL
jgi:hypothetical protein